MQRWRSVFIGAIGLALVGSSPAHAQQVFNAPAYVLSPFLLLAAALLPIKIVITAHAMGAGMLRWAIPVLIGMLISMYLMAPIGFVGGPINPDRYAVVILLVSLGLALVAYVVDLVVFTLLGWSYGLERIAKASALGNVIVFGLVAAFGIGMWNLSRASYEIIVFIGQSVTLPILTYSPISYLH
ncbi:MAG: hypothetical protein JNK11_11215 [Alphaproteobacteria bacterium]|nr:hypothetical protein [Alphaproteobacteria bacterium]